MTGSNLKHKFKRILSSINVGYAVPLSLQEKFWRLENDPAWMTIDIPVDGRLDAVEEVLAEKMGDNQYRIASSPGMIQGLAADDRIAIDRGVPAGFRLLQRGDNVCVHLFCDAAQRDRIGAALTKRLGRIGGVLDGTMGHTGLCFTIPALAGFTVIEGALRHVVGDEWSYSNIYDPTTGAPLKWWLKQPKQTGDES